MNSVGWLGFQTDYMLVPVCCFRDLHTWGDEASSHCAEMKPMTQGPDTPLTKLGWREEEKRPASENGQA